MAVELATAYVSLVPSAKGLSQAIHKELVGPTGQVAGEAGHAAGTSFGNRFSSAVSTIAKAGALGLAVAGVAATKVIIDAVGAAEESQKVAAQTTQVIQSTGAAAHVSAGQVSELASALSAKSGVDDELIQSGANVLLTFTKVRNEVGAGNDIFNQATATALDMSVALGQDMQSSVIQLGKALNDPIAGITALTRVGVTFTQQQKDQIAALVESGDILGAQKVILQELNTEFGGSAAAQATASDKMRVAIGNLQETIGGLLLPVAERLSTWITATLVPALESAAGWFVDHIVPGIRAFAGAFQNASDGVTSSGFAGTMERIGIVARQAFDTIARWVTTVAIPALQDFWRWIQERLLPVFVNLGNWLGRNVIPPLEEIGKFLVKTLIPAIADLTDWLVRNQDALAAIAIAIIALLVPAFVAWAISAGAAAVATIAAAAPIILIGALIAGAALLIINHWDTIKAAFAAAYDFIKSIVTTIINWVRDNWKLILVALTGPIGAAVALIITHWDTIKGAITAAVDFVIGFVQEHWPLILAILTGPIGLAVLFIQQNWDTIVGIFHSAVDLVLGIWQAGWDAVWGIVQAAWELLSGFFTSLPGAIAGFFASAIDWLVEGGRNVMSGLWNGISEVWGGIVAWAATIPQMVKDWFWAAWDWLFDAGGWIISGLKNGITAAVDVIGDFLGGIKDKIVNGFKSVFGISSPSTVMMSIGAAIIQGLIEGMFSSAGQIKDFIKKIGLTITDLAKIIGESDLFNALIGPGFGIFRDLFGDVWGSLFGGGGGDFGALKGIAGVEKWRNVALAALAYTGQSASWVGDLLTQMAHESGGNQFAINLWDINAQQGHPSQGLMQTIPSTFQRYAAELAGLGIFDPFANIVAAIRYTIARYGDLGAWRRRGFKGYASGGIVPETGMAFLHRNEGVFTPEQMRVLGAAAGAGAGAGVVIGPITINADTEAGGRAAARGFLDTLTQRRILTDARIA